MDQQGDEGLPTGVTAVIAPRDLTLDRSLRPLVDAVRRLTRCDTAFLAEIVWALDAGDDDLGQGGEGAGPGRAQRLGQPDAHALARRALRSGEVLVGGEAAPDTGGGSVAVIAAALVDGVQQGRPWGVLGVAAGDAGTATSGPQAAVAEFADLIAQRIRDEHDARDELRAAARDRATLARHTSVMLAAERELLAPLTAARGWAATVLRPDLDHDRRREAGKALVAQLDVLWSRLNGLWSEAHLAVQGPVERAVIDLAATVRASVVRHQAVLDPHDVEVDADGPVEALGDVDVVADLLARLLDNVNLHTPMHTRVDITVRPDPPTVVVRDHGPGWPETLPRAPLSTSRPMPLAGTGLFAATGMAESIGATLQAVDVDGPGVALQLTLSRVEDATRWEGEGR